MGGRSGSVDILVVAVEEAKIVKFVDTIPPSSPSPLAGVTLLFILGHGTGLAATVVADCRRGSGTGGVGAGAGRGSAAATGAAAEETAFRRRGAGTGFVGGGGLLDDVGALNAGVTTVERCLRRGVGIVRVDVAEVVTVVVVVGPVVQLLDAVVADEPLVWMVSAALAADVPRAAPPDGA